MKLQSAQSATLSIRCSHRTPTGRQCRLPVSDLPSGLCPRHHADHLQKDRAEVSNLLFNASQAFQTAQGINNSLCNLYWLVAQDRVSNRRASVLAYIGSLLLRTLPAIDADRAAGIIDPTAPEPPAPIPNATHSTVPPAPPPNPAAAPSSATAANPVSVPGPAKQPVAPKTWDTSFPEPDPNKKPS